MKKRFVEDVYVKLQIAGPWYSENPERAMNIKRERALEAVAQIERHVDDVYDAEVVEEVKYKCEHCKHIWTEDSDTYNGGCCWADEANNPNPQEHTT